jgi:branched-chain amino acid transport system permease protein
MAPRIRDNGAFRFWCFVGIPLAVILYGCFHQGRYYTGLINTFGIYIILVASLNLVNGLSGIFSMGHAACMAIGAYAAAFWTVSPHIKRSVLPALPPFIHNLRLPIAAGMLAGGIAAALVALVVGVCVLRMKGHYLSVATLGLIIIVRSVLDNADQFTNGARGITGLPDYAATWTIYGTALVVVYFLHRLLGSRMGRELVAMRDDYIAARAMAVNTMARRVAAFTISAFLAGVGGGLWGHLQSVISGKFYYYDLSFRIVQTSIIGGMYTLSGAFVGPLIMIAVPELLRPLEAGFTLGAVRFPQIFGLSKLVMSGFLVVLIIFRRKGIMGDSEIIVTTIFSPRSWRAAVNPREYAALFALLRNKWKALRKGPRKRRGGPRGDGRPEEDGIDPAAGTRDGDSG